MAQFDVHRNLGPQRTHIPYVVVVQSRRLDAYQRRVVVPLVSAASAPTGEPSLNPRFLVESVEVVLHPLEIVSVSIDRLGPCVASLADKGDSIIAAIDIVISRGFG